MQKILFVSANPNDTAKLRLDEEAREIQRIVRSATQQSYKFQTEWAVTVDDLRRALLDEPPTILHFSGHGTEARGLVIEGDGGKPHLLSIESLTELLSFFKDTIECVFLNACDSKLQAEQISRHINYAIGMQAEIQDAAAIAFARGFYQTLGAGRSYLEAYQLGCNAIAMRGFPQSQVPILKVKSVLSSVNSPTVESAENKGGVSINLTETRISGGIVLVRGQNNAVSINESATSDRQPQLDRVEVIEILVQIEELLQTSQLLPDIKDKSLKYLRRAKIEITSSEPDRNFAADDLKRMSQTLHQDSLVWDNIKPVLGQLPPWLGVSRSYFG